MKENIKHSANIKTDEWIGSKPLKEDFSNLAQIKSGKKVNNFPELHRSIMSFKGWLRGMDHKVNHLQAYIDEYCYRFNRSNMKEGILAI